MAEDPQTLTGFMVMAWEQGWVLLEFGFGFGIRFKLGRLREAGLHLNPNLTLNLTLIGFSDDLGGRLGSAGIIILYMRLHSRAKIRVKAIIRV